jgi:chromosome segregation ATPase
MDKLALILAILALIVGGAGYWRSGGDQDVAAASEKIEEEVEELQAKQRELAEKVVAMTRSAYSSSQDRLRRAKERLVELSKHTEEGLQTQVKTAIQKLEALQEQVAERLKSTKESTIAAARETQQTLARQVRRLEARVDILEAKLAINRAMARAEDENLDEAEEYLREALLAIKEARRTLGDDRAHEPELHEAEDSLRQAIVAVKEKAKDVKSRIERVATNGDRLIELLEKDERPAMRAAP